MSDFKAKSVLTDADRARMAIAAELRDLIENDVRSSAEMRRIARQFEVDVRTVYRWREKLKKGDLFTTMRRERPEAEPL